MFPIKPFISYFLAFLPLFSLDADHQQMISMWQTLHIDMKSLLSWQYFMKDFTQIRSWNINMVSVIVFFCKVLYLRLCLINTIFATYGNAELKFTATLNDSFCLFKNVKYIQLKPSILHSAQLKNMKPEEYRLIMRNLELHYQDYMRDSQNSQLFGPDDCMQVEEDYTKATQHFDNLLQSMEKGNIYSLANWDLR